MDVPIPARMAVIMGWILSPECLVGVQSDESDCGPRDLTAFETIGRVPEPEVVGQPDGE